MILLLDYTCVRKESHNWDSLKKFREAILRQTESQIIICVPSMFSKSSLDFTNVRLLEINPFKSQICGKSSRLNLISFFKSAISIYKSTKKLITELNPTQLIWINSEAASLLAGIFLSIRERELKFYFRFVGWTEFWTPLGSILLKIIFKSSCLRKNVFLAFETRELQNYFGGLGTVVPYPIYLKEGVITVEPKNILLLGSGRQEKGLGEMCQFARELSNVLPHYQLVVQEAVTPWDKYSETMTILNGLKNVKVLPAILERQQLENIIQSCTFVILPYDRNLYRLKGSASLFEAVENQKPVIAFQGCGFSTDISEFYLGLLATDVPDLVRTAKTLERSKIKNFGFDVYAQHSRNALQEWLGFRERNI